jgi:hypothetical protein
MQSLAINKLLRMAPCGGMRSAPTGGRGTRPGGGPERTGGGGPERAGGYVTSTQFRVRSMAFFQPA